MQLVTLWGVVKWVQNQSPNRQVFQVHKGLVLSGLSKERLERVHVHLCEVY